jgi:ABC-type sugar transport system substrate-binding protein
VVALPAGSLVALGASAGTILGVAGLLTAGVAVVFQEWRPRQRTRRITFIGKSHSVFSESVSLGLHDGLSTEIPFEINEIEPTSRHESGTLAFQLEALRRADARASDALVILPACDHEDLWSELRHLTQLGVFLVVVDVKAPNRVFYSQGAAMPSFVTSAFQEGGALVGQFIAARLRAGEAELVFILSGPDFSPPAQIRNSAMACALLPESWRYPVLVGELSSWDEAAAVHQFQRLVARCRQEGYPAVVGGRRVIVFCGNDKNCMALDTYLKMHAADFEPDQYFFIGYDGVRNGEGELLVARTECAVATVDTSPRSQGRSAAAMIVDGYHGRLGAHPKNAVVTPRLLSRPDWM